MYLKSNKSSNNTSSVQFHFFTNCPAFNIFTHTHGSFQAKQTMKATLDAPEWQDMSKVYAIVKKLLLLMDQWVSTAQHSHLYDKHRILQMC